MAAAARASQECPGRAFLGHVAQATPKCFAARTRPSRLLGGAGMHRLQSAARADQKRMFLRASPSPKPRPRPVQEPARARRVLPFAPGAQALRAPRRWLPGAGLPRGAKAQARHNPPKYGEPRQRPAQRRA